MTKHREIAFLVFLLALFGAMWGATQPLSKIAVSTGYRALGLVFWQFVIGAIILYAVTRLRGKRVPMERPHLKVYLVIALIGTLLPNTASYEAIRHIPSGLVSILLSMVPLFAFPIALLLAVDHFSWRRLLGLLCGLIGVMLIVLPEASLPERAMIIFIPLALIAPIFYAFEGNYVARWGTAGLDPVQVLCGSSIVGAILALPFALLTGQFIDPRLPWGPPEFAMIAAASLHAFAYTGYVWMVGRTGPVFAVQVSYLVTGFGVLWAILFLDESYSGWVWAAMALMFVGMFLVQPRRDPSLAPAVVAGDDAR
ncbi:MAG: DMT family transporter [Pseudomonadota bacterium]